MKSKGQRLFALVTAILFFATSVATTGLVIWQIAKKKDNPDISQNQNPEECTLGPVEGAEILAPPPTFKSESKATGLVTNDLDSGTGDKAKAGDCLEMKYYGTIANTGTSFDENFTSAQALRFKLGEGQVIPGWDQGIADMPVGTTRRLIIPSELAYGDQGACLKYDQASVDPQAPNPEPPKCLEYSIPPNTDLVFVVKLLKASK